MTKKILTEEEKETFIRNEIGVSPDVKGYRLLLRAPKTPEKLNSGIYLPPDTQTRNDVLQTMGLVLKIGPTAFKTHPSLAALEVQVGEWVEYARYEREEKIYNGVLCFYINDERIYSAYSDEDAKILLKGAS